MSDNVIPLFAERRKSSVNGPVSPAFHLRAQAGTWSIDSDRTALSPDQMIVVADILRDIARGLKKTAYQAAGQPPDDCIGEFVMHQSGGIDYWISPDLHSPEQRARLKIALRNAIASLGD